MDAPVCSQCQATSSLMWHKNEDGSILCLECRSNEKAATESHPVPPATNKTCPDKDGKENSGSSNSSESSETSGQNGANGTVTGNTNASNSHGRRTRLRERAARGKQAGKAAETTKSRGTASQPSGTGSNGGGKTSQQKAASSGGGRRQLKQARPQRAPKPRTSIITSDSVVHKVAS